MRWTLTMAAVILWAFGVVSAEAAVFCMKKSGAVFIRTACKKRETQVDLASFGVVGPKGDKGDQGDPGMAGPPGSTLGVVGGFGPNPDGSTALPSDSTQVTTTASGALLVFATGTWSVTNCISGPCGCNYALYVDGQALAKSQIHVEVPSGTSNGTRGFTTVGVAASVAPGMHNVELKQSLVTGSFGLFSTDNTKIAAIGLGS
jgi:hypothetical protein